MSILLGVPALMGLLAAPAFSSSSSYCDQHPGAIQCQTQPSACATNPSACGLPPERGNTGAGVPTATITPSPGTPGYQGTGSNPGTITTPGGKTPSTPDKTYQQDIDLIASTCMQNKPLCGAAMGRVKGQNPAGWANYMTCANGCGSPDPGAQQTCITGCLQKTGFQPSQGGESSGGAPEPVSDPLLVESMLRNNKAGNFSQACSDAKAVLETNAKDAQAAAIAKTACQWKPKPKAKTEQEKIVDETPSGTQAAAGKDFGRSAVPIISMEAPQSNVSRQWQSGAGTLNDRLLKLSQAKADGNYASMLDESGEALKLKPNDADILNARAFAQNRLKDYKGALATANQAVAADPNNAAAHANRAYALGGLGDRAGMIAALRRAAALDPRFEEALQRLLDSAGDAAGLFDFPGEVRESNLQGSRAAGAGGQTNLEMIKWIVGAAIGLPLMGLILFFALRATILKTPPPRAATPWPQGAAAPAQEQDPLRGKYELGRQIGAGGMGVVFEGRDLSLDRKVAVKKMLPQLAGQPRERQRFVSEAKTVAALHHPNIVDIHAIVEGAPETYLIFEYVTGKTLHELVSGRGRLPFAEAMKIIRDVAAALDFAHASGIVHRDLKPANVMINDQGFVKVMDFGLARAAADALSKLQLTNTVVGTPAYMAPEQEYGVVCKQSDVYSLAVCLYEMLAGKRPFDGAPGAMMISKLSATFAPVSALAPGLPPGIDGFFTRALAADKDKRIPSVKEFIASLDALGAPSPS